MATSFTETEKRNVQEKHLKGLPFKQWWLLYVGTAIVGLLSMFAGAYLGMSPDANGNVNWVNNWDLANKLAFAAFYMVMFFVTAEAAFLFWLDKLMLHDVDENQKSVSTQLWTAWPMLVLSLGTMVVTSIAASQILAFWRHSFGGASVYPTWTRSWILEGVPFLIIVHIIFATLYKQSTKESQLERWRKAQMRIARTHAMEEGTKAYTSEFNRLAPTAARAAYTQMAQQDTEQLKAELGIWDKEKKTGQDINGDGYVGRPPQSQNTSSIPSGDTQRSQDERKEIPATNFSTQEVLAKMGLTLEQAQLKYGGMRYGDFAGDCSKAFGSIHIGAPNMKKVWYTDVNPTKATVDNHR